MTDEMDGCYLFVRLITWKLREFSKQCSCIYSLLEPCMLANEESWQNEWKGIKGIIREPCCGCVSVRLWPHVLPFCWFFLWAHLPSQDTSAVLGRLYLCLRLLCLYTNLFHNLVWTETFLHSYLSCESLLLPTWMAQKSSEDIAWLQHE